MSLIIKITQLLCCLPLPKPVLHLFYIKGHLSHRVGLHDTILAFPGVFSRWASYLPPQSGVLVRPINQTQLLLSPRKLLPLEPYHTKGGCNHHRFCSAICAARKQM